MSKDNVVFLAFDNPNMQADSIALSACGRCKNKTFRVVHEEAAKFPMLQCAACGSDIGRFGWAHED